MPHWWAHVASKIVEHDVESDAGTGLLGLVRVHRVMQPGWKYHQGSGFYPNGHLAGVVIGQLGGWWHENVGLGSWVVKGDAVSAFGDGCVIDTTKKVIWMAVRFVSKPCLRLVGPATGDRKPAVTNFQEIQRTSGGAVDKRQQAGQGGVKVKVLSRLQQLPMPVTVRLHGGKADKDLLVNWRTRAVGECCVPNVGGKQRQNTGFRQR